MADTNKPIGVADELLKLAQLKDAGVLTEEEFNAQKARLLGVEPIVEPESKPESETAPTTEPNNSKPKTELPPGFSPEFKKNDNIFSNILAGVLGLIIVISIVFYISQDCSNSDTKDENTKVETPKETKTPKYTVVDKEDAGIKNIYKVTTPDIYPEDSLKLIVDDIKHFETKEYIQVQFYDEETGTEDMFYALFGNTLGEDKFHTYKTKAQKEQAKAEAAQIAAGQIKIGKWVFHDEMGNFTEVILYDTNNKTFYSNSLLPGFSNPTKTTFKSVKKKNGKYVFTTKSGVDTYELEKDGTMWWRSTQGPTLRASGSGFKADIMDKCYKK